MPKLKQVVASILESLNGAQHKSNLATRELLNQYKNDEYLRFMMLPNAVMSEVDVALRFMIKDESSTQGGATKANFMENQSPKFTAERVIVPSRFATKPVSAKITEQLAANPDLKKLIADESRREFIANKVNVTLQESLAQKGLNAVENDFTPLKNALLEELNAATLKNAGSSGSVIESEKLKNAEAVDRFMEAIGTDLTSAVENVSTLVYDASSEMGDLDVVVDGNLLVNENAIQTIHIKATMKNYRCVTKDNSDHCEFVLSE